LRLYTPPIPFEESAASKEKWSDLIPALYGKVFVAWENLEPTAHGGAVDLIFLTLKGEIGIGGWYYDTVGDEWEKAEPQELKEAFEDGFIVTSLDLAVQWAAMMRKQDPDDKTNLALEEILDYIGSREEIDCE
jgi:hypothetical protein